MKHRARALRKFRNAVRLTHTHLPPSLPAGFFMTDPTRIEDPVSIIEQLPDGIGVIIRHFGEADAIEEAAEIAGICRQSRRICLIGADAGLARELGADGVHWPARLARAASRHASDFPINTMSAHTIHEVRAAERAGMDAAIVSTVFVSDSPSAGQAIGLSRLARIAAATSVPVYALGGIGAENVERTSKIAGFASVSAFSDLRGGPSRT